MKRKNLILLVLLSIIVLTSCDVEYVKNKHVESRQHYNDTIYLQKGESFKDFIVNDGDFRNKYIITQDTSSMIYRIYKLNELEEKYILKHIIKEVR